MSSAGPSQRLRTTDIIVKDKHGFASEEVSLYGAFTMEDVTFRDPCPESMYTQVSLQNNKLWIFTTKNKLLAKKEMGDNNTTLRDSKAIVDDSVYLKRAKIRKMFVDETGMHCFLVSDTELYYNHWESDCIYRIDVFTPEHFSQRGGGAISQMMIKSIDIKPLDDLLFEVLLGTACGHILHGCYMARPREGDCQIIDPFVQMIENEDGEPILDIKIVTIKTFLSILAVSPTKLNQFVGTEDGLKVTLDKYKNDP